jgi:hypothetical protein
MVFVGCNKGDDMKIEKVLSRDEAIDIMKLEFDKMPFDKDFYIGFLQGALEDNCIKLDDGWREKDIDQLRRLCAEAHLNAATKIVSGEILKSEGFDSMKHTLH